MHKVGLNKLKAIGDHIATFHSLFICRRKISQRFVPRVKRERFQEMQKWIIWKIASTSGERLPMQRKSLQAC